MNANEKIERRAHEIQQEACRAGSPISLTLALRRAAEETSELIARTLECGAVVGAPVDETKVDETIRKIEQKVATARAKVDNRPKQTAPMGSIKVDSAKSAGAREIEVRAKVERRAAELRQLAAADGRVLPEGMSKVAAFRELTGRPALPEADVAAGLVRKAVAR